MRFFTWLGCGLIANAINPSNLAEHPGFLFFLFVAVVADVFEYAHNWKKK